MFWNTTNLHLLHIFIFYNLLIRAIQIKNMASQIYNSLNIKYWASIIKFLTTKCIFFSFFSLQNKTFVVHLQTIKNGGCSSAG